MSHPHSTDSTAALPPSIATCAVADDVGWPWFRARTGILTCLALTVASAYLTRHCLGVANTRMQAELHFNNEQFGYLYGAFSVGYLIFQIPGGWLGQRLGTRWTIGLLCGLWSLMTLVTGIATSYPPLLAARFAFGALQAGLIPNQAQALREWFPDRLRGTASAAIVMAMSVGGYASQAWTAQLLADYHWRTVLIAYSVGGVAWAVLFVLIFRSRPSDVAGLSRPENSPALVGHPEATNESNPAASETAANDTSASSETPVSVSSTATQGSDWKELQQVLLGMSFWALFASMIFKAAGYNLLVTFLPAYLEYAYGVSPTRAGELTSWSLVAVVVGSPLGGGVIDLLQRATGNKRISRVAVACLTLFLTATIMLAATFAETATQAALIIAGSSLVMGMANPCTWATTIDLGGRHTAVVMGCVNMGSALPGILISPAVGRLMDDIRRNNGNWALVLQVHAVFYVIAAICWLLVDPRPASSNRENAHAV